MFLLKCFYFKCTRFLLQSRDIQIFGPNRPRGRNFATLIEVLQSTYSVTTRLGSEHMYL